MERRLPLRRNSGMRRPVLREAARIKHSLPTANWQLAMYAGMMPRKGIHFTVYPENRGSIAADYQ